MRRRRREKSRRALVVLLALLALLAVGALAAFPASSFTSASVDRGTTVGVVDDTDPSAVIGLTDQAVRSGKVSEFLTLTNRVGTQISVTVVVTEQGANGGTDTTLYADGRSETNQISFTIQPGGTKSLGAETSLPDSERLTYTIEVDGTGFSGALSNRGVDVERGNGPPACTGRPSDRPDWC
ncbi:hypothetical protein [Halomarina oriensis]|uniref:Uncharacterized protein n=1 Tax=Halomarina oriensis TaxID=671145 RepID=A0A6B0GEM1_9EURY|nr:hypothetical protein [Halomarina oriensis]MWG33164.1 hypothetical protein [Halomarina oriensis]